MSNDVLVMRKAPCSGRSLLDTGMDILKSDWIASVRRT
ncbi:hypothetical protein SJ05684_b56420 (plasmid) [Sinorhizobium sojae CCBAU 05684]|uniref:Uncharacterized protein n=1 Tax=Sinorhizobium sojae CCBAU 05684 TaxID=716928 RepID=A0A249PLQ9_9HYPH|nr:hypothetical protein SJ05684_b56420 [Sinorhizobium sojae CCBAU 05684]